MTRSYRNSPERLAADLDQYAFDRDTYGYQDAADNREEGIHQIREQLAQGELSGIQESIRQDLAELEGSEDELRQTAEALLVRLDALQKESKEEIAADGKTSPVPEEIEKQLTKNQTGKMEKKRETEKTGSGQQERASVLQRLSSGKERAEKSPERSRKPREKSPER